MPAVHPSSSRPFAVSAAGRAVQSVSQERVPARHDPIEFSLTDPCCAWQFAWQFDLPVDSGTAADAARQMQFGLKFVF